MLFTMVLHIVLLCDIQYIVKITESQEIFYVCPANKSLIVVFEIIDTINSVKLFLNFITHTQSLLLSTIFA